MKQKSEVIDIKLINWRLAVGIISSKHYSAIIQNLIHNKRYTEANELFASRWSTANLADTIVENNNRKLAEIESKMKEIKELKRQVALNNKHISKLRELA
jgi:hypothetical protein